MALSPYLLQRGNQPNKEISLWKGRSWCVSSRFLSVFFSFSLPFLFHSGIMDSRCVYTEPGTLVTGAVTVWGPFPRPD